MGKEYNEADTLRPASQQGDTAAKHEESEKEAAKIEHDALSSPPKGSEEKK